MWGRAVEFTHFLFQNLFWVSDGSTKFRSFAFIYALSHRSGGGRDDCELKDWRFFCCWQLRHPDTSRVLSRSAVVLPLPRYVNLLPKPSRSLCAPVPQPILIHCRVMSMRANRQMEGIRTSNAILKHFILDQKCVKSTALPHIYASISIHIY